MIDGIDYYPKRRKGKIKFKLWVALLLTVALAGYWYFESKRPPQKSKSTLIMISKPETKSAVNTIPIVVKPSKIKAEKPEILENLDEVLQNYNQNNQ